jgi:hypothetical protein
MTIKKKTVDAITMNVTHIIRGWAMRFGFIQTSKAEEKLSELRLKICSNCPFVGSSNVLRILNGNVSNEAELYCTKCTCPCVEKTLVADESCQLLKW